MQALKGSLVALITPMKLNGDIDYEKLDALLDWHIEEGTNGIVSVGTTGESATLNVNEHIHVIEHTVTYVNKRVPVIAGTGANSTSEAIELTEESKKIGADYSLIVTPYYNKPNQKGLIDHYNKIADSVDIPQILYNVPSRTACDLLPPSVEILSKHKNIIGIKEAVGTDERIASLIEISKDNENFLLFSGDDPTYLNMLKKGGDGVISVAANVVPKMISNICKYVFEQNNYDADQLDNKLTALYQLLFVESNPVPVKWMLYKMNKIENSIRLPLVELENKYKENITSEMLKLNLL
ncbi:MAG: 4-hydroxy-tetrahydrodipicolinate synthase [SAR86 cluster bacterium]|uniref:4-hydroxy-tetrahydrodipicolinate synthase n=1 Tax=SAR86 cluster bacterium TaxID=2030880 RepID=A0A520N262_9GAMM|nr:MAG: 4-hydroxy-tetrahydrodipicolinate synthase [SAR86 cluster bacterium]|tara:strand:- start:16584 stop:17471 length:888 start_codon:yes stop_codon:yes gene_type:complete